MSRKDKQVGRPITMNPFTIAAQAKKRYYDKLTDSEDEATINITSSLTLNNNSENPQPKLSHLLRENLKFNQTWLITYPWLRFDEDKKLMFCNWCEAAKYTNIFVSGCDNFKEQSLKRHLDTKDHQKTLKARSETQLSIVASFTKQLGIDKLRVIRNMINMYWLIQHNIATHTITDLCNLIDQQIQNAQELHISSNINILKFSSALQDTSLMRNTYGSYNNNHAGRDFIDAIGKVIEEEVCYEIRKSSAWSLMIDESNTVTKEKTLAIVSKHITFNMPVYRFVGLIELKDCSANGIMKELNEFFKIKNLSVLTLGHFGSDGASVMLGHLNGIAAQLKSQNPFITEHHCISHRLALACEDAAESIPYMHTYNKIVGNLYTYFSRSYERMETLKMVEKLLDDPDLHLLRIVKTRWLSLSNVVSNLHRILDSVVNALFLDSKTEKVAQSLLDSIDQTFYITTNFLADILGNLKRLTLSFQSEHISLTEIKLQIATVIQTINESFIGTENFSPTWGYHLRTYLQTNDLASEDIPDFIQQFAIATIENLNRRFPDRKILNAFSIFDPQNLLEKESLSDYGNDEIYILANYYGKEKTSKGITFSSFINAEDLIQEWNFVRILLKNFASLKLLDAWKALYQKIPNFSVLYPNSYKIVELFLILPLSNAVVERVFSRQNLIKTKLRNRMNINTLNYLLSISINGSSIDEFDFERAYDIWENSSNRYISQ